MFHWLEKLIPVFVESVLKTPGNPPLGGSLHFFFLRYD